MDEVVAGVRAAMDYDGTPYGVVNLGNNRTMSLAETVQAREDVDGVKADIAELREQSGDVPQTWEDVRKAQCCFGY